MALDRLGGEKRGPQGRDIAPPTLAKVELDDIDIELEAREAAERVAITRTVRRGRDAWDAINKAQSSFDNWLAVGRAMLIGREIAMRSTGSNAPMGRRYCLAFSQWLVANGFTGNMQKSVRSVAVELAEHATEIIRWRDSLPLRQRRRLIHPLSVTRRWRASTLHNGGQSPQDIKRDAVAAWRRFTWCLRSLPAHEARPICQAAIADLAAMARGS